MELYLTAQNGGAQKGGAQKGGEQKISRFFSLFHCTSSALSCCVLRFSQGEPLFARASPRPVFHIRSTPRCFVARFLEQPRDRPQLFVLERSQFWEGSRPQSRQGFTRQPESPNVHISGSRPSKKTPKIVVRTPKREKKERKLWRERVKKSEILGGPAEEVGPAGCGQAKSWTHPRKS